MPRESRLYAAAGVWGIAEAMVFFIVPDVWLSWLGMRSARIGLRACAWALAGALVGGGAVYTIARMSPGRAEAFLYRVPGIHPESIAVAQDQIARRGLTAVLLGPIQGRPYKIYAVEWAAAGGALLPFLLISIPARLTRFILSVVAGRLLGWALSPWTRPGGRRQGLLLVVIWTSFYAWYFHHVGW